MKLVAENVTITSRVVREAIDARNPAPIREIAALARKAGAIAIDVNLGPKSKSIDLALDFILETLEGAWKGGIWIDGSDAALMERAARLWSGPLALNGFSGNRGREGIAELAAAAGCDLVVFLMTDSGIPRETDERLALAAELVGRSNALGVATDRIIVDPVLAPAGWMDGQALNAGLLETLRKLPELFGPGIRSVVGLSNLLTTSAVVKPPAWLAETFLGLAAGAGLTHAMVDVANPRFSEVSRALSAFGGEIPFAPADYA